MTLTDIIQVVRKLVNDDSADANAQRLDDADYTILISDGMRYIFTNHPESRVQAAGGTLLPFVAPDPNNPMTTLPLSDVYFTALTLYVAFKYYSEEGGDARDNKRAAEYWKQFEATFEP